MLTLEEARRLKPGDTIHQRLVWPAVAADAPCSLIKVTALSLRRRDFLIRGVSKRSIRGQVRPFQVAVNRHSAAHFHIASESCHVASVTAEEVARA